jgi:hypothetical protein
VSQPQSDPTEEVEIVNPITTETRRVPRGALPYFPGFEEVASNQPQQAPQQQPAAPAQPTTREK